MGVSFKREDTMRFFHEMAFLLLPLLVSGKIIPSERDGKIMDTSEKLECYVWGQCEEYSVNFEKIDTAEACHKFCGKNDDCKWWTWVQDNSLCSLFANCTDPKHSAGHPNAGPCSNCISGQHACHARDCHSVHKCQGILVDTKVMDHLEDCVYYCRDTVGCEWYTYNKKDDHCVLYENCNSTISCDTCASGPKDCSKGYHGDDDTVTEAVTKAPTQAAFEDNPFAEYLQAGCQQQYECLHGTPAGEPLETPLGVEQCKTYCETIESCKFYTWGAHPNPTRFSQGWCYFYQDCERKEKCPDCASGSMEIC